MLFMDRDRLEKERIEVNMCPPFFKSPDPDILEPDLGALLGIEEPVA